MSANLPYVAWLLTWPSGRQFICLRPRDNERTYRNRILAGIKSGLSDALHRTWEAEGEPAHSYPAAFATQAEAIEYCNGLMRALSADKRVNDRPLYWSKRREVNRR